MMSNNVFEKSEVQAYISYLQDIINRMAANSCNCKSWLITANIQTLGYSLELELSYFSDSVYWGCANDVLKNGLCYGWGNGGIAYTYNIIHESYEDDLSN